MRDTSGIFFRRISAITLVPFEPQRPNLTR